MNQIRTKNVGNKIKSALQVLPTMGIAFVVLGVIILIASFVLNLKSNFLLFAGLFFVVAGCVGYVYSLKKR